MLQTELELKHIWHRFKPFNKDKWILKNINLSIKAGELVGLLGPSGCGKTTLLRLIAGFEKPCDGSIKKNGQIISDINYLLPPERRKIGMVFQDYALFPHLNVWDNICFGITSNQQAFDRANWLLDLLGIYEFKSRFPHELSGGQCQRVSLARALAPDTSLLLLDEPFCSLDVQVRSRLRSELSSVLKSCATTALLVTHDPHEALAICDRIAVLKDGEIQQFSKPSDIVASPSNDFVGKFVLQKNVLPISFDNEKYSTIIGTLNLTKNLSISSQSVCMFDMKSIKMVEDFNGLFTVFAKEYRINYYIYTILINDLRFIVQTDLNISLNIGDKCMIKYLSGSDFIVLPENIKSSF